MRAVRLSLAATRDLEGVRDWIARDSPRSATAYLRGLAESLDRIADLPKIGRSRPEVAADLRSCPHRAHVIFYQPVNDGIVVVHVLHGRQDVARAFL